MLPGNCFISVPSRRVVNSVKDHEIPLWKSGTNCSYGLQTNHDRIWQQPRVGNWLEFYRFSEIPPSNLINYTLYRIPTKQQEFTLLVLIKHGCGSLAILFLSIPLCFSFPKMPRKKATSQLPVHKAKRFPHNPLTRMPCHTSHWRVGPNQFRHLALNLWVTTQKTARDGLQALRVSLKLVGSADMPQISSGTLRPTRMINPFSSIAFTISINFPGRCTSVFTWLKTWLSTSLQIWSEKYKKYL